ncbi:MAG: hypothetical protein ACD_73C00189G0005 [uncultured bacterium]|nr:MAG: hypothetical protein ACD_73C00189G0005 [uncultured bacterium]
MQKEKLPRHVAIIMDGNGRWAKSKGLPRVEGHKQGVEVSENIIDKANEMGLKYLTLYAFSRENWNRPKAEVSALMSLLKEFLIAKKEKMLRTGIKLNAIGDLDLLPTEVRQTLEETRRDTAAGKGMTLTLALSYGARDEILRAIKKLLRQELTTDKFPVDLTEEEFAKLLDTDDMPDPDLIIRTSGEHRLSNFLLWQAAYAEFVFNDCLWPDFTEEHLKSAIKEYHQRERRFGKTSDQLKGVS